MGTSRYMSPETRTQILKDNESLTGSMRSRAEKLGEKYGYTAHSISLVIKPTMDRIQTPMTEEVKEHIRVLYSEAEGKNDTAKFKSIAEQVGYSWHSVRVLIKEQAPSEKESFFNPKMEMF